MGDEANQGSISECNFQSWVSKLDSKTLNLWREAMAQVRQTHGDVWNGVRFFLTVNGIIIAAIGSVFVREHNTLETGVTIAALAVFGLILTIIALHILGGHREYYLAMLVRKTLLESELGFYDVKLYGVDLSLPWRVEEQDLKELKNNPVEWQKQQMWRGKITPYLRYTYWMVIAIYVVILILVLLGF
jgi:hypothetical protein